VHRIARVTRGEATAAPQTADALMGLDMEMMSLLPARLY